MIIFKELLHYEYTESSSLSCCLLSGLCHLVVCQVGASFMEKKHTACTEDGTLMLLYFFGTHPFEYMGSWLRRL